jgi:hypothetical protein
MITIKNTPIFLSASLLLASIAGAKPVKVFILAGQSNMDGQAEIGTIDFLGEDKDPARAALLKVFKPHGKLMTRNDVWVANADVYDKLQPGFGGRKDYDKLGSKIGPEYAFGYYMGEAFDEPVLLIKYAPGGQSLYQNFRSPSAGLPHPMPMKNGPDKTKIPMTTEDFGGQYRGMISYVHETLDHLKQHFPLYNKKDGYEIAGMVWFQGFNDMIEGGKPVAEYGKNLICLIKDLRKEFKVPDMKVVVGVMGVNGVKNEGGKQGAIRNQMRSMNKVSEFNGNVKAIESAPLCDAEIVAIKTAGWLNKERDLKKNPVTPEEAALLKRATSNLGFHYYGEGRFEILLGKAFADTMLELMDKPLPVSKLRKFEPPAR